MELFKNMLEIYGKLSGHKFKGFISGTKFALLAKYEAMTNDKLLRADYDLVFQKLVIKSQP